MRWVTAVFAHRDAHQRWHTSYIAGLQQAHDLYFGAYAAASSQARAGGIVDFCCYLITVEVQLVLA